jgi:hypothetical protein
MGAFHSGAGQRLTGAIRHRLRRSLATPTKKGSPTWRRAR